MWSLLASYLDLPPYTAPAPISSAVKIPEGLELAKCGREDCNGYVQVRMTILVGCCDVIVTGSCDTSMRDQAILHAYA